MKIPLFSKLTAKPRGRKVVRASAARAARGTEDDYYDEAEPNMKLSHAFMVVLILHIVAVGGIYAFNQINAKKNADLLANISGKIAQATGTASAAAPAAQPAVPAPAVKQPGDADDPLPAVAAAPAVASAASAPSIVAAPPAPVAAAKTAAPKAESKPVVAATKPSAAPKVETVAAAPKNAPEKAPVAKTEASKAGAPKVAGAPAGTYTVAKGDNPYTIAKKLGVNSAELLSLNGITDPTKLQIGQVLKVPGKSR